MKFFVWVSRKRWGFVVLPVLRDGDLLYKGEETFFDFEDDTWELNFSTERSKGQQSQPKCEIRRRK